MKTLTNETKVDAAVLALEAAMKKKMTDRPSANWQTIADVDWDDLEYYIGKCRLTRDKDSFDTALAVLTALKDQVLNRKPKG